MKLVSLLVLAASLMAGELPKDDGYRGIWYYNQRSNDKYVYKYSGGFATYPQQHTPIAVYSEKANKTFFVYGGTAKGKHNQLVIMVSYYDHATGRVPRPRILLDKQTEDAHDNATMSIDDDGYIWIFAAAHGTSRPAYIYRSRRPYAIDDFELIWKTNFSYPQPWHIAGKGFLFLHTRYLRIPGKSSPGRALYWMTSPDGKRWSEPHQLAFAFEGHYQISWPNGRRVGTAFNTHPPPLGGNGRTNLYYLETSDMGRTWRAADARPVPTPVTTEENPALVRNYREEGLLVYLKDLQYDKLGHPVILYLTSKGYRSGPDGGPRTFWTAHWTGESWTFRTITETDHNYDYGSLYIEQDGTWRFIAPTIPGPQPFGTGGEIEMWLSKDEGRHWKSVRWLTRNSAFNHTYVRRPLNAHPDFYALWADGNAFAPSESSLYFTNKTGDRVCKLPSLMEGDYEEPQCKGPAP